MTFNVNTFRSSFRDGGARPNLFSVQLNTPAGILPVESGGAFEVKAAQLPSSTLPSVDVPYFGRQIRVAGNRTFDAWTVTVMNKENFSLRNAMENWMASINSHVTNQGVQRLSSYKQDASVYHYGKTGDGAPISTYKFEGLFPTEVSTIELGWDTNDSIEEFTVTFAFDWWTNAASVDRFDRGSVAVGDA
jgi:hypothetical protein|tara:strand:- start:2091 stop:2660 length:570 start_codon:yes stop_codon:yes gene_type:complete